MASTPPEALLYLPVHGGTVIAGDALQNWESPDRYFSWLGRVIMRKMGFLQATNVGSGWVRQGKPPREDLLAVLDLPPFANVFPAHGTPVLGGAKEKYRPALERVARR
jgi:hypothetical protein